MNMNCLFIDTGAEKILIETGIGDKWTAKQQSMYGIDRVLRFSETLAARTGTSADEITIVVNTHLHFDHAGGNTRLDAAGKPVASFPNARYFVSRAELEHAESPTERDRAKAAVEQEKAKKVLDEIVARSHVKVPDNYTVKPPEQQAPQGLPQGFGAPPQGEEPSAPEPSPAKPGAAKPGATKPKHP
jgi:glyoxylase-like metal-dependent hydrolase (beta-lactamase superfamily II)